MKKDSQKLSVGICWPAMCSGPFVATTASPAQPHAASGGSEASLSHAVRRNLPQSCMDGNIHGATLCCLLEMEGEALAKHAGLRRRKKGLNLEGAGGQDWEVIKFLRKLLRVKGDCLEQNNLKIPHICKTHVTETQGEIPSEEHRAHCIVRFRKYNTE